MSRKRSKVATSKKKGGGLLIGMRQGVQKVARDVTGQGKDGDEVVAPPTTARRAWNLFTNVLTVVLGVIALIIFLRRCGVLSK